MTTKLVIGSMIIGFWLMFPFVTMFMMSPDYQKYDISGTDSLNADDMTILGSLTTLEYTKTYFQILFIGIPNAHILVNIFIWFLRLISGLVLYLLIRGS